MKTGEPDFADSGGAVEVGIVRRLAARQGLALHRYSVDRYGAQVIDAIQREFVAGVVRGLTQQELVDRIAAAGGSVLSGLRGRAALIARMETSRAYNDAHLEGILELDQSDPRPDDPLLKKIDEFFDQRNHPFSRAANERVALPQDPFVVPVAEVDAAARAMRRPSSGVLWARVDGNYVGQNLPAHFNERGRIIPWRASWGPFKPSLGPPQPPPKPRVTGEPDYAHEGPQAQRLVDMLGGDFAFGTAYSAGIDGTWTSPDGRQYPVSLGTMQTDTAKRLWRNLRDKVDKARAVGATGAILHANVTQLTPHEVLAGHAVALPNQLPDWRVMDRVILDFGGDTFVTIDAAGARLGRLP